jgi:hypothetical protein
MDKPPPPKLESSKVHPEDEALVQLWADGKITWEDALRRAKNVHDVRLGMKSHPVFLNRLTDDGEPDAPEYAPHKPKRPPGKLSGGADVEDEPRRK